MQLREGDLAGQVTGEIHSDDSVLVIRSIHVVYELQIADEHRETAARVLDFHARFCPVARTLEGSVEITTELRFV